MSRKFLLIVAAAAAVGSFLPWASVFGISVSGIQGDGVITLAFAIVGAILAAIGRPRSSRFAKGVHATLGIGVTIIAGYHLGGFAAMGVYVTVLAGLAWAGLALVPARLFTRTAATEA